ncbi:MAG: glycoside hydrolase family 28 protein [Paludibacter sp.]|nr:glycoside hydrolase family 28 protein [Bacteroidales bacterium]MCM1069195.1 glycoside hydrolase family 28 protein [Prevotella sp.]MCM1354100.1 glycoside hydrolase family 28 protein [Bacteroides sp.]MCM1442927.1 glycoside hydrolase family 28 protein [Muribaculum sp.]MCM1481750.1 glycoside hydrolase family 28 protein [Paludibacter sp.]
MKKTSFRILLCATLLSCQTKQHYQYTTQTDIDKLTESAAIDMPQIKLPAISDNTYSVLDFGATNDGSALSTQAIQNAIDRATEDGGGTVIIPAGIYTTGPIELKSNVRLYTERNALILFSSDFELYPIIDASFEGVETKRCQSPISARNAENIAICGYGSFNGNGDAWRPLKRSKVTGSQWKKQLQKGGVVSADGNVWYPTEGALYAQSLCIDQNVPENVEDWESIRAFLRPVLLNFINCKNVLLEGVCFENSPAWNLHPLMCENVVLKNLTVRNPWYSQNGDGVDIESCKNVLISDCSFDVGDDAICMKSGKNADGRRRGIATENVLVDGCTVYHGHGGFVVGSEMSGDVRNITVSNCLFIGTDVGLRFKSTRGRGGIVENICISNVNMSAIPNEALLFDLFYGGKAAGEETEEEIAARMAAGIPSVTEETPQFRNINIENVICKGAKRAIYFNGLPEMPIENVSLSNIRMTSEYGAQFNQTNGLMLKNVHIDNQKGEDFTFSSVNNLRQE